MATAFPWPIPLNGMPRVLPLAQALHMPSKAHHAMRCCSCTLEGRGDSASCPPVRKEATSLVDPSCLPPASHPQELSLVHATPRRPTPPPTFVPGCQVEGVQSAEDAGVHALPDDAERERRAVDPIFALEQVLFSDPRVADASHALMAVDVFRLAAARVGQPPLLCDCGG
jgi:hypothetical protein